MPKKDKKKDGEPKVKDYAIAVTTTYLIKANSTEQAVLLAANICSPRNEIILGHEVTVRPFFSDKK